MRGFSSRAVWMLISCAVAAPAQAQLDQVTTPPPNFVLPNYDSTPVGPYGGLEGVAYVARVGDPSAAWFNPAGLARQSSAQISGSAGVYQRTLVSPVELPNQGGSIQQLPNFVGFTFSPRTGVSVGAALLSTIAWTQETDAERVSPGGVSPPQRFAYSADSEFEQRVAAIAVGYDRDGPWRVGGGFAFSLTDLRLTASVSDRIAATSLQSLLVSNRTSGSAIQLRGQGGAQYDTTRWRFGGAVRTPGATLHRTGQIAFDGVVQAGSGAGASLFDADAAFEYRLPWEFQGGTAFVTDRVEAEVDIAAYTSIASYPLLSTSHPVIVYTQSADGLPPSIVSRPFAGVTTAAGGVVNGAAGGHVKLLKSRDLRVHAGLAANRSPATTGDPIFNKVDLTVWSIGASGTLGKLQFAVGLHHQAGRSDNVRLRNLLNAQTIETPIDIRTSGLIYSLAYQF